jgi:hypothetical protein
LIFSQEKIKTLKMKFALVESHKAQAVKGVHGTCPNCGSALIAKCGEVKINHWAHKGIRNCDRWWENETAWHRSWKNNFPAEWQEISLLDERTGEKHIADVRTGHGLVIEFQHSHMNPQERTARENFYKNMIWVVDGTRLKNDYKRLLKGKDNFRNTGNKGIYFVSFPEECFPSAWLGSPVPVIFDFRGAESINDLNDMRNSLYCLFPKRFGSESILVAMSHEFFIKHTTNGELKNLMENIYQFEKNWQNQMEVRKRQQENIMFRRFSSAVRFRHRRRRF